MPPKKKGMKGMKKGKKKGKKKDEYLPHIWPIPPFEDPDICTPWVDINVCLAGPVNELLGKENITFIFFIWGEIRGFPELSLNPPQLSNITFIPKIFFL